MTDSRAAVVTAFNKPLELWSLPLPEPEPGGVIVKVDAATLCGTDAHRWSGRLQETTNADLPFLPTVTVPYVPGHETCGTIVELRGPVFDIEGRRLKTGDRIISSYAHCGHCYYCRITAQPTFCAEKQVYGASPPDRFFGGCAEYHAFPAKCSFIRVPDNVPPPVAASATCALRTIMHSYEQIGGIAPHETILTLGSGPLGLYALAVGIDKGAQRNLLIGAPKARLDVGRAWGAHDVLDIADLPDAQARIDWVRERTGGRGADVVVNCATAGSFTEALRMTRPGGKLVQVAVGGPVPMQVQQNLMFRGVTVLSTVMAEARHFHQAIQFVATRGDKFDFGKLISNSYPLSRTGDALKAMEELTEVKPLIIADAA
jgi:D-arabinose 1-dehydrogenase-like Zn-dependent alcohol dehydrogenase